MQDEVIGVDARTVSEIDAIHLECGRTLDPHVARNFSTICMCTPIIVCTVIERRESASFREREGNIIRRSSIV